MKIYIAECGNKMRREALQELVSLAKPQIHTITENPEEADIILITHSNFTYRYQRQVLQKYLDKCYTLSQEDKPNFILPGLYASAIVSFLHKHRVRGFSYIFNLNRGTFRNAFLDSPDDTNGEKKYLFSFVGSSGSWVRKRLFKMKFQRSDVLIRCTNEYQHWNANQLNREAMQKSYVDIIRGSKFVLCPRGVGRGSVRLFESMKLGVAPIVISDKWLPPIGPDWHSFALFVKESELKNLPKIVERHASEYEVRGRLARKAWEEYFSDTVVFNHFIKTIDEDLKPKRIPLLDRFLFYSYPIISMISSWKKVSREWIKSGILSLLSRLKLKLPYELRSNTRKNL